MKKTLLFSLLLSGFLAFQSVSAQNITFDDGATWKCDQFFDARPLRYMKTYQFYDEWINGENKSVYLNNYAVKYKNANYLSVGQLFSNNQEFYWTKLLVDSGYRVPPRSRMPVLSTFAQDWGVVRHPTFRSNGINQWDFLIGYKIDYDYSNNYPNATDDKSHVECQPYYVTWCGDGVRDPQYEQCDGTDGVPAGQSCTASCTLTSAPACINLSSSVTVGNAPLSTNVSCTTQNATSVAIDCGNGQTINSATGTCTYNQPGTYQAVCRVDGNITNNNCQKSITVNRPPETTNFDLRIKKYAKGEDVFASVDNTEDFNYNIVVQNVGPERTSNTTTVVDTLPTGVGLRATPSGNGWTCTGNAGQQTFRCDTGVSVDPNQVFNVITVPVRVTNLAFRPEAYVNYAYVYNPNEMAGRRCNADGSLPNSLNGGNNGQTPTNVCNQDTNNFDPATISPPNPNGFDLRLKKYVNGDDESSHANGTATYTFQIQNLGALASTGRTTVTDSDFPDGITIASIATTQGEWTCTQNSATAFTCFTDRVYAAGEFSSVITLTANIPTNLSVGAHRNIACLSNPNDPHENARLEPSLGLYRVNNCDPAEVFVVPAGSFDLSLKKYVADTTSGTEQRYGDHQTTNDGPDVDRDILNVPQGGSMRYKFFVRNLGPVTATGTTTVEDTLPNDTTIIDASGTGWNCSVLSNSRSFTCYRQDSLGVNEAFPEIVVNVRASTTIPAGEYSNIATVRNPGDTNPTNNTDPANIQILVGPACGTLGGVPAAAVAPGTSTVYTCSAVGYTGATTNLEYQFNCGSGTGAWSTSNTGSCAAPSAEGASQLISCGVRDRTNSGVVFTGSFAGSCQGTVRTTTTNGPSLYIGKVCVNNVASCATFNSTEACRLSGVPADRCRQVDGSDTALRLCRDNDNISCGGGGGGGGGGTSGRCGDGVLQAGEECDIAGGNSDAEGALCSASCKLRPFTTPGENPITQFWMTIPTLSGVRFGSSFLDATSGRIPFEKNGIVIGQGGKVFTLADVVGFGLKQRYQIPLMVEAEKQICLEGSGDAVDGKKICTTFAEAANLSNALVWTRLTDNRKFVVIGNGDFQYENPDDKKRGTYLGASVEGNKNEVNLFKGASLYKVLGGGVSSLNSAFQGKMSVSTQNTGEIRLITDVGTSLASLPVRVSGVLVGTTATPVNRRVAQFIYTNSQSVLASFLGGELSALRSTTSNNTVTQNPTTTTNVITIPTANVANPTIGSFSDLAPYKLNGNENIFAIKGNVTITNCPTGVFIEEGVRTVIVEGTLTIKCNIWYGANDASSSWSWIVKGGDTIVDKDVTNLAGVYVNIGGKIDGTEPTSKILKIDGSMYGNADGLFQKHLYARGTSAYDILTTGTIITYSNRALVNPPPLLSQYLSNYSVSRVTQ